MNKITKLFAENYLNFRETSIQTFNDQQKADRKYSKIMPMTPENLEWCEKLQAEFPYWVYFSVNPMQKGRRDIESVKMIQTWICDIDTGTKEEQLKLIQNAPLKPTYVNESVHGFHLYYLASDPLTREQYTEGNLGLKDYYNGDIKVCKDVARVLRIPWFMHMKGEPTMVDFRTDLSSFLPYTVEEIYSNFPKKEEVKPVEEYKPPIKTFECSDSYRYKVNQLDTKDMLLLLSGSRRVWWDVITFRKYGNWEQIICNGKETGCWLDRNWLIGSWDHGWPTWIQRIERYGKIDWGELAKRLNANHPELEGKKKEKVKVEEKIFNPTKVPKLVKPDFTRWNKELDSHIGKMKKGQLVILLGETWAGKTTFATFMARKNNGCCYYVLEDKVENIASRYAMKRAWITVEQYNEWTRSEQQELDYEQAYLSFRNRDILLVDIGKKIEIEQLIESIKEMKAQWHTLFFIDNLGFIIGNWQTEADQTADISSKLVSLCLEENICIVLLHHFKKKGKAFDQRDLSQMRGSWKLGDDAFTVVEYIRDEEQTFLRVFKDRTWGNLKIYEIGYDRGEYYFIQVYKMGSL